MKKRMLWKIVAALCLVALIIPFFPALTATQVDATTNAPYPWAMEAYGQAHSRIYTTKAAPAVDGRKEESYTDLGKTGSFISSAADGSNATSPAEKKTSASRLFFTPHQRAKISGRYNMVMGSSMAPKDCRGLPYLI